MKTKSWGEAYFVWLFCAIFWGFWLVGMTWTQTRSLDLIVVPIFFTIIGLICWGIGKSDNNHKSRVKVKKTSNKNQAYCCNCYTDIPIDSDYCPYCGSISVKKPGLSLFNDDKRCPRCGAVLKKNMKKCARCGYIKDSS